MKVCVLGCGAFGCAIASVLADNNNEVWCWSPQEREVSILNQCHISPKLPDFVLSNKIWFTSNIEKGSSDCDFVVIAVPMAFVRSTLESNCNYIKDKPICIVSKGIEHGTCLFISEIVKEVIESDNIAVLSGPSFALDVVRKMPIGLSLACNDSEFINKIFKAFSNDYFKLQLTDDIIGTELCGAIKNVIAIGSGILDGCGFCESTCALYITLALHDIKEFIVNIGGSFESVISLAGVGDLILTASSLKSRNYSFGFLIGSGKGKNEANEYIKNNTVEGLYTLDSIIGLAKKENISIPLIDLINDVVNYKKEPKFLIDFLINRRL